MMIVDL